MCLQDLDQGWHEVTQSSERMGNWHKLGQQKSTLLVVYLSFSRKF